MVPLNVWSGNSSSVREAVAPGRTAGADLDGDGQGQRPAFHSFDEAFFPMFQEVCDRVDVRDVQIEFGADLSRVVRDVVIGGTRNWARAVLLWNLVLDAQHGPHTGGCTTCVPLITVAGPTRNQSEGRDGLPASGSPRKIGARDEIRFHSTT